MTVLITGAAGFIGRSVAKALRQEGHAIRAGTRRASAEIDAVACDLDRPEQIAAAVSGVSVVVHCAYGDETAMARQCAALLDAMAAAGVNRLVFFSSIAVYGDAPAPDPAQAPDESRLTGPYARGKAACERLVRQWVEGDAARAALILRPGIVYGAGSHFWVDKPARRIEAGLWGDFGSRAEGLAPLIHVDDVARAACLAVAWLESAQGRVEAVDLIGPQTPTWNAYFRQLAKALGHAPLPSISPARLAWWRIAGTGAKAWRKAGLPGGSRLAFAPASGELRLFSRTVLFDMARTQAILGFSPSIGVEEGLARTFAMPVLSQETSPDP